VTVLDLYDNPSDKPGNRRSVVSLYSGVGGLDDGFERAGFHTVWANDFDADAVAAYNANLGDERAHHGDINDLKAELYDTVSGVDVVIGGPPCQGFSVAGHMDPADPRSQHVWTFLEAVERFEPEAFVMENVKALATNVRWSGLMKALCARARSLGYSTDVFVLNAADYRVPQSRERMFFVGIKGRAPVPPAPSTGRRLTVLDALNELPPHGQPGNDEICSAVVTPARNPVLRKSPWAGLLFNGKGRALNLHAPALTLPASMGGNRTPIIDERHRAGGPEWIVEYHARLTRGEPPVGEVPKFLRRLTVQEAAAIQTFRRGWSFIGPQTARFRQIGNAVPPRMAYAVAIQLGRGLNYEQAREFHRCDQRISPSGDRVDQGLPVPIAV
jgi:DNA (cytosine-5)-methyltransferase 1